MLQEHAREMRRVMSHSLEKHSARVVAELRAVLAAQPAATGGEAAPAPSRGGRAVLWFSAAAGLLALVAGALWLATWWPGEHATAGAGSARGAQLPLRAPAPLARAPIQKPAGAPAADVFVDPVPFGESPLAGARTDHVQAALDRLLAGGFRGTVEIRSFFGRFCLQGNGEAQTLAGPETSYAHCDQIGNPLDPAGAAARESVAFANMLAAVRARGAGALEVQVSAGAADEVSVAYPAISEPLTAGEWNRAAAANNRVEVRWRAAP
jgi:hypothetical protein